jgi:hypothetical protein
MNFIEAALTALRKADSPLDFRELWSLVVELGLDKQLASTGKTPWNTMGARVYIEVRDNPDAEIVALGERPKRFWLKSRALPGAKSAPAVSAPAVAPGKSAVQKSKPEWLEADLHPVLAHFARHTMGAAFVSGRSRTRPAPRRNSVSGFTRTSSACGSRRRCSGRVRLSSWRERSARLRFESCLSNSSER